MPGFEINAARGWTRRLSLRAAAGGLLLARNARYLASDNRLWALLGRSKFNAQVIAVSSLPTDDEGTVKSAFAVYYDGSAGGKLVVHKGGTLWEADLDGASEFTEGFVIALAAANVTPRGIPAAYRGQDDKTLWLYPVARNNFKVDRTLIVRPSTGTWRWGGHLTPTDTFTLSDTGSGTFSSSTEIKYGYRVYDSVTDTESAISAIVAITPSGSGTHVRLTFAAGVFLIEAELGTHVRIYRSLLDEAAGIMYRQDGTGNGIPIADFVAGHTIDDNATNVTIQLQGTVRADGQEGTVAWAEHGGPPPKAGACIVFDEHMVYYDLNGRLSDLIYSAQGFPESCPVDIDGNFAYFLRMESDKDDRVLRCTLTGGYLLVFGRNAIYKVSKLPTFEDPGFTRRIQDRITSDHGIAGKYAAASFDIGAGQSQRTIYAAIEHGLMVTDAVETIQVLAWSDFPSLVEPTRYADIQMENYTSKQEVWVAFTPKAAAGQAANTKNTQVLIIDYSAFSTLGLRITGPVDAKAEFMVHALGTDNVNRLYLGDDSEKTIYVQDSGNTDKQENTNSAGDIQLDWELARYMPVRQRMAIQVHRLFVYGTSGVSRIFNVIHKTLLGQVEETINDKIELGPGEVSDQAHIEQFGQGVRTQLTYLGPTGTTYSPDDAGNPPALESIEYDYDVEGEVMQTRDEAAAI